MCILFYIHKFSQNVVYDIMLPANNNEKTTIISFYFNSYIKWSLLKE